MDDLINYLQKNTVRKASSISKIKTKSKPHPNQNDFTGIKMKNNINLIFNSFNEYNRRLKNSSNKLIKSQGNTIAKENIIIGLRKDLEYHKLVNKNYNVYKEYANEVCDYYKQNYEEIFQYKANLRYDLRDFVKIVDGYEEEIEKYKNDRIAMIKTSEDIIKFKKGEKVRMEERLRKLNNDLEIQGKKLTKVSDLLNDYQTENETYQQKLVMNELTHLERYEILNDKYKKLLAKYDFYINKQLKMRKLELEYKDKNLFKEEEDLADLKLQDNLIKNLFLRNIANEIRKQIKEIQIAHQKYNEEEEMIKVWGKSFYNKLKKRKLEMELLSKENNNKADDDHEANNMRTIPNTKDTNKLNNINIHINFSNLRKSTNSKNKSNKNKINLTSTGTG